MIRTIASALALLAIPAFALAQTPGVPGGGQTQSKMTTPAPQTTTSSSTTSTGGAKSGKHRTGKGARTSASPRPTPRPSSRS